MKKLYLILLMLLILFIPNSVNAVAVYQLDQPVSELNGHSLRDVFQDGDLVVNGDFTNGITGWNNVNTTLSVSSNVLELNVINTITATGITQNGSYIGKNIYFTAEIKGENANLVIGAGGTPYLNYNINNTTFTRISNISVPNSNIFRLYRNSTALDVFYVRNIKTIDLTSLGISHLTVEQMDNYYNLYLEALRFENENQEASQDIGGYQNIFRSIVNGVKNLISEMGYLWQWLNAPILTSDFRDYQFNIDWSWDLIGVIRQIINSAGVLVMQILFFVPSAMFILTGIPIQISILSLLFSNLIFLLLGWIMVKSFLI